MEHIPILTYCKPETVIDVGANRGQFALAARHALPKTRIIAFEPLPAAAEVFEANLGNDAGIDLHRLALSDKDGQARFHVAGRTDSSSLLALGKNQASVFGVSADHEIEVTTVRMDKVLRLDDAAAPILLKIDVQGAEHLVLEGAKQSLPAIAFVYVECSYISLYDDQALFSQIMGQMAAAGFELFGAFNTHFDPQLGPIQADVLFRKAHP
ncbi:FkbM family methyltransferase [Phenylobacterium sp.]|uniref:FkbM family methyltransferase n=1 Tax=Phenylobacterium sp. TaxID=1871053 RepID=UPI00273150F1|nr:FkbM family methyltransferase [Phenylobacterium sp.]MDP1875921.1 FkbM family methyltransferase [Phenylobacterium sp.]